MQPDTHRPAPDPRCLALAIHWPIRAMAPAHLESELTARGRVLKRLRHLPPTGRSSRRNRPSQPGRFLF